MTLNNDYSDYLFNEFSRLRRHMCERSFQVFAELYLPHHFCDPPSRMHMALFSQLEEVTSGRGRRVAVAAPRGHAKTTQVSLAYVLWCALYKKEPFVLIISSTREQAVQRLMDIKKELTDNPALLSDFPEVCLPLLDRRGGWTWKEHLVVLPNETCIRVLGSGQGLRGMKRGQHRPSLIVCDDLEELEAASSAEQRLKLKDWFEKTLLKAGTRRTNAVVIGTILHYDSLLANLTCKRPQRGKPGGWESHVYQAVESFSARRDLWDRWEAIRFGDEEFEDKSGPDASKAFFEAHQDEMLEETKVLWPQREDYYHLMCIRADEGQASFQSEKQNEPLDPDLCLFREDSFRYWDDPQAKNGEYFADVSELLRHLGSNARIFGACDPAMGARAQRGDYSAVITLVMDSRTKEMYVIGADIARRKPDEMIESIVRLAQVHRYRKFAVESNQFQEVIAEQLKDRVRLQGVSLRVEKIKSTTNKQVRIDALEPLVAQSKIIFSKRHPMLLEQLRQFPLAAHDDGP